MKRVLLMAFLLSLSLSGSAAPLVNRSYVFREDTRLDKWDGYIAKEGAMLYTWENAKRPSWTVATRLEANERLNFKWMIAPRLRFQTTYILSAYRSLQGGGRDNMSHILNVRLTTALLKDSSLELSLSGNDLISSPAEYAIQTNALYMTQT